MVALNTSSPVIVHVITIFPQMFLALSECGITQRAFTEKRVVLSCINPRDFVEANYRSVDDRPYGGGPGMVMQAEPLAKSITLAKKEQAAAGVLKSTVMYLSPQGSVLTHEKVMQQVAKAQQKEGIILLCGRYEGIDERLISHYVDEEISIGDFVVSGGEIPAMAFLDAIIRQLPGVLHDADSARQDSFVEGLLDYPHYTRPEVFEGEPVPSVLLSGHHEAIRRWRLTQSLARTKARRPDLLGQRAFTHEETQLLRSKEEQCDPLP